MFTSHNEEDARPMADATEHELARAGADSPQR
jgi:hypothetical protein